MYSLCLLRNVNPITNTDDLYLDTKQYLKAKFHKSISTNKLQKT